MRGALRACRRLVLASVVLSLGPGCRSVPPLRHAAESPRALADAVLDALARGDRPALERLAVGESEFRDHVWPRLPAARPERNLPFSYVWGDLHQKSQTSLGRILEGHRGRAYRLVDVRFDGGPAPYADFVVHREAVFVVGGPDGQEEIRVCGSFLEKDGRWKVFSYVVDD